MTSSEIHNQFKTVCIIGMGLMGGSLALRLKKRLATLHLTVVDFPDVLQDDIVREVADKFYTPDRICEAVSDIDLVIIATPISRILEYLPILADAVRPGTLITDMGSTKSDIVHRASTLLPDDVHFIGGHPMTGSEERSIHAADPMLFENAIYVLTPEAIVPPLKVQALGNLLEVTGARVLFLSPALHDRIAAAVSHLPQLLAITLTNIVANYNNDSPYYFKLAAGGFRDITRIAASSWDVWGDILSTNKGQITECLDTLIEQLHTVRNNLQQDDLKAEFKSANLMRQSIPKDNRGFMRPQFDLIVWAEDRPGIIADMASGLAKESINIKDIELLKVREDDAGTFRIAFESEADRKLSKQILEQSGYTTKY
ncbi:prephenate dehydrogenase [bacterium]|nr:prephenate dehydrogenase [bacterium]